MIKIIQLWMNLNVYQYHPNSDDQNHPTMDEFKHELIYHPNSDDQNHPTVDESNIIHIKMFIYGPFPSIFGCFLMGHFHPCLDSEHTSMKIMKAPKCHPVINKKLKYRRIPRLRPPSRISPPCIFSSSSCIGSFVSRISPPPSLTVKWSP